MKRLALVAILVVALLAIGAVAAFAAPSGPGRAFSGMMGMMGQGGYGMMAGGAGHMGEGMMGDDLEELLGISHADIHAAHIAGKSLVDIAAEKGVTEDQLIKAVLDGRKTALDQAVTDGKLTQEAADQMLTVMQTNIQAMVEAKGMSGMMGLMRGSGMMGGYQNAPGGQSAPRGGGCHGGQAPTQQGTDIRNNTGLFRGVLQQG